MCFVDNYSLAVAFCVITMFCWGSWGNTQKLAGKTWRYELFYWDYVLGVLLFALVSGLTFGSFGGAPEWGFVANLKQASAANLGSAFLGGIVFNAANILLAAAIAVAGMSVAFPVGIGLALVLGVVVNYIGAPKGNAALLFGGVALISAAIVANAWAYKLKEAGNQKKVPVKGIVLSIACGVLMAFFYRFVAAAMDMNFTAAAPKAGMLTPYSALFVFARVSDPPRGHPRRPHLGTRQWTQPGGGRQGRRGDLVRPWTGRDARVGALGHSRVEGVCGGAEGDWPTQPADVRPFPRGSWAHHSGGSVASG